MRSTISTSIIAVLLLTAMSLFAPNALGQNRFSIDELSNIVVCITDERNGKEIVIGTGTIIEFNSTYYLITADHVQDSIKGVPRLVFRTANDKPVSIVLASVIENRKPNWIVHSEADIAVLKLKAYNADVKQRFKSASFPFSQVPSEKSAVPRSFNTVAIGYPVVDVIATHFSPLTFNSYFSSGLITLNRGDTKTLSNFQLLENPSVQGYSGGPVFVSVAKDGMTFGPNQTLLVGIMHGTYSDNTGGKLAMVTPAYYIHDIIK